MKNKQKSKSSPKNSKHPYSCSHFQFHLNDEDPNTINAKFQLQQISSALDNYDQKQIYSHLRLFTMHNEKQKTQSLKLFNQRKKLFKSQNLQKQYKKYQQKKSNQSRNTLAEQWKRRKIKPQESNFCNSKQIKINLSFNNIQPSQDFEQLKLNQINKIIKKSRPMSQKKENYKKIMSFSLQKQSDNRIHSHTNLNIIQKLKSNFLSTSIYQFNQQTLKNQQKMTSQKSSKQSNHHRALSQPFNIHDHTAKQNESKKQQNPKIKQLDLQISPPFSIQNYSSYNLQNPQRRGNKKCLRVIKLCKEDNQELFVKDAQLKQDFQQLKRILKNENQNVLSGKFHKGLMMKYSKRQYKNKKAQRSLIQTKISK